MQNPNWTSTGFTNQVIVARPQTVPYQKKSLNKARRKNELLW